MQQAREILARLHLPQGDRHDLPSSDKRFPDGAQYRIEIPSCEGPAALRAVIEEADRYGIVIQRISQGSGIMLLTDEEIPDMARLGRERGMEGSPNPAAIVVMERLRAGTYNIPTDLTLAQIAAIRQAVDIPLDVYVEAPDDLGGFIRHYEIPELIRVASPVYVKFGLRNAPN